MADTSNSPTIAEGTFLDVDEDDAEGAGLALSADDLLLLRELNPGIRKVVATLRQMGFQTVSSGDGRTHECAGCDADWPYVSLRVAPGRLCSEANRLAAAIEALGFSLGEWTADGEPAGIVIEASYFVQCNEAVIELVGLDDGQLVAAPNGDAWAGAYAPGDWADWLGRLARYAGF